MILHFKRIGLRIADHLAVRQYNRQSRGNVEYGLLAYAIHCRLIEWCHKRQQLIGQKTGLVQQVLANLGHV